ncbi:MAG: MFS transporter [Eggerthellaceae bacterium]|jgi:EmrB/QacA subfamily drug resistance transporter
MSDDDRTARRAAGRRAHARGRRQGSGDAAGASAKAASASSAPTPAAAPAHRGQSKGYVIVAVVYLLGLFMGALDMGIVSPARVVIQNDLGIGDEAGVWIITIYSLAYAASIPVMGKLADKYGRKYVYLTCIFLFGLGSLLCGLSQNVGSYGMLIASRVIQAIGGGGIVPVATAEFGTAFPEEKRGVALGLVGAVYGIASVFGSAAGSLILQIFGQTQWQFIFYVNVPICIFVLIFGLAKLKNTTEPDVRPIDGVGICVMTVMILSLMYGLRNIDFFNLGASITQLDVWPYLVAFCVLVPVFVAVEHRAADPVMNLAYFKDRDILITLMCSIITGIVMMATIFFPQFCENCLFMPSGSGGYFIIILGLFCGIGSPMSGKLIDAHGVKPVLGAGFVASIAGALYLVFVAAVHPSLVNVIVSLALIGLGMGFTMGTPLNYMMLQKTDDAESNSALATLSLVRSIGTAVAPAIMVAFVAHAGASMQASLMEVMPTEVTVSPLPYAQELDEEFAALQANPQMSALMEGVDVPNLESFETIEVGMGADGAGAGSDAGADGAGVSASGVELSDDLLQEVQNSDVTTIVDTCKDLSVAMFAQVRPQAEQKAQDGIAAGIDAIDGQIAAIDATLEAQGAGADAGDATMAGASAMTGDTGAGASAGAGGQSAMTSGAAVAQMVAARDAMQQTADELQAVSDAIPGMFDEAQRNYLQEIDERAPLIQETYQRTLNGGFQGMFTLVAVCSMIGLILLAFYRDDRPKTIDGKLATPEEQADLGATVVG